MPIGTDEQGDCDRAVAMAITVGGGTLSAASRGVFAKQKTNASEMIFAALGKLISFMFKNWFDWAAKARIKIQFTPRLL